MQTYIFISGNMDSLSVQLPDEPESIKLPDSILNKVIYRRDTLRVGDASITSARRCDWRGVREIAGRCTFQQISRLEVRSTGGRMYSYEYG
jgi:hypothetical protein